MEKRIIVFGLLAVAVAAAAISPLLGPSRIQLSHSPTDADHVTLYQNGLATVNLVRSFNSDGDDHRLSFTIPSTTVFDSIRVEGVGVSVHEFRTSLSARSIVDPGDQVTAHVGESQIYRGTVLALNNGQLLLSQGNGTVVIDQSRVTALEVRGRPVEGAAPGSATVDVLVSSAAGNHTVKLSYLAKGSGWTPSYILDAETGDVTFYATLAALEDWKGVGLDLVAGSPNVVYEGSSVFSSATMTATSAPSFGGGAMADKVTVDFDASERVGDLHRYHFPTTVSFAHGEAVRLALLTGRLDILRHYFEASFGAYETKQSTVEHYQLRNTLRDPLPSGTVRVYLGDTWIASDHLPQLGPGEQGNITVSTSSEVKGDLKQPGHETTVIQAPTCDQFTGCKQGRSKDHDTYLITMRNLRSDGRVDVRVHFQPNYDATVQQVEPPASEKHDRELVWNAFIEAGSTGTFRVISDREYAT